MLQRQIEGSDSPSCAVLVLSCDQYQDLWTPFLNCFKRFWPDCGMPVYLGADNANANVDWVSMLNAGDDTAWSRRLRFFLKSIDADYVLLMLEDFFLDRRVSNEAVLGQLHLLHSLRGVTVRLFPNTPADYFAQDAGVIHTGAYYRVSLQAAIWNRSRLLDLLVDEESPWEFEKNGTQRSRAQKSGYYCVKQAVIHYRQVVERGQWFRSAARYYGDLNIGCDFTARSTMTVLQACKKLPMNYARRLDNWIHSRWLCLRYPEKVENGG